jgi:hypothetical protein
MSVDRWKPLFRLGGDPDFGWFAIALAPLES